MSLDKSKPTEFKTSKLLKELPKHLKNPRDYWKIKRFLLDVLGGKHSHSEMKQWASCKQCMDKANDLVMARKKLGFKTPAHYYAWDKVMSFIYNPKKMPIESLVKNKYLR